MARPSKLSPAQWAEVERRILAGEGVRALAREFGVDPASITRRFPQQNQRVRNVAESLAAAQNALAELPIPQQHLAVSLADKLRNISSSLASAAELGAKTSHRLQALANDQVAKVDDADPMKSVDKLRDVGVLTKLANDSASIALNLLAANKERVKALDDAAQQSSDEPELAITVRRR